MCFTSKFGTLFIKQCSCVKWLAPSCFMLVICLYSLLCFTVLTYTLCNSAMSRPTSAAAAAVVIPSGLTPLSSAAPVRCAAAPPAMLAQPSAPLAMPASSATPPTSAQSFPETLDSLASRFPAILAGNADAQHPVPEEKALDKTAVLRALARVAFKPSPGATCYPAERKWLVNSKHQHFHPFLDAPLFS